jgi:hypothetical protein
MRLTRILTGILFLVLLHHPIQTLGATFPGWYSVVLGWDGSPSPEVVSYNAYYGAASRIYTNSIVVGNVTSVIVPGLVPGVTYFFAITAVDAEGLESDFSDEVSYTRANQGVQIRAGAVGLPILTVTGQIGHTYDIEATEDFTAWSVVGTVTPGTNGSLQFIDTNAANRARRFYRTRHAEP